MTTLLSESLIRKPRPLVFVYVTNLLDRLFVHRCITADSATTQSRSQNALESA